VTGRTICYRAGSVRRETGNHSVALTHVDAQFAPYGYSPLDKMTRRRAKRYPGSLTPMMPRFLIATARREQSELRSPEFGLFWMGARYEIGWAGCVPRAGRRVANPPARMPSCPTCGERFHVHVTQRRRGHKSHLHLSVEPRCDPDMRVGYRLAGGTACPTGSRCTECCPNNSQNV
jgi:hypothetical protein